jgi:hypothetical protein
MLPCNNGFMTNDTKMLQLLLDGQSAIRKEMREGFTKVNNRIDKMDEKLTERIDKLGLQLAKLEDDAPTIE